MKVTNFYSDIFEIYSKVKILKEQRNFYQVHTIVYYLADINQKTIKANDIWEIDIRSAFPTICQFLFKDETEFIDRLNELADKKLERNIFISTTLKGTEYLKELNQISKMIISSILMDADPYATVLELKKDGIAYIGKDIKNGKLFRQFSQIGFQIRRTKFPFYIRYQKTSHFLQEDGSLLIKGIFKERPNFLTENSLKLIKQEEVDFELLDKIYSKKYFEIIRRNTLNELFSKYYLCDNNKYISNNFHYEKIKYLNTINNLIPKNYLRLFLYPFLLENSN